MVIGQRLVAAESLFVIATTTGCYDDKATFVSTSSETMLPETIGFQFLQKQSLGHFVVIK